VKFSDVFGKVWAFRPSSFVDGSLHRRRFIVVRSYTENTVLARVQGYPSRRRDGLWIVSYNLWDNHAIAEWEDCVWNREVFGIS